MGPPAGAGREDATGAGRMNGLTKSVRGHVLYPSHYAWYVLASSLDIILTYTIIYRLGGREVNAVAARLVERFEHWGLIGLKFATVIVVVATCEAVGRRRLVLGRRLVIAAIVLSAMPVGVGLVQIVAWLNHG